MLSSNIVFNKTTVVRSWAVDAKINLSKNMNCQPPLRSKIQPFLDILGKGSSAKIFFKGV